MKKNDFLIIGSGLFGSVFAHEATKKGFKCLMLEKRNHIGGNIYTSKIEGIDVHMYGPHYFHTNSKKIWDYINKFSNFYNVKTNVKVNYKNRIYSFPINLLTLNQLWGVKTPQEAELLLNQKTTKINNPSNLEEWALSQIGEELYEIFYKGYTEKQWNKKCTELPATIIKRLPVRFTYDDSYHNAKFQGIPSDGYTSIIEKMLQNIEVKLNTDFFEIKDWKKYADRLIYTGPIDRFFNYELGMLEYRSLHHETKIQDGDFQGCYQMNYTEKEVPYTRIIEHKHFLPFKDNKKTVITWEYPQDYNENNEPFYPIGLDENLKLYCKYLIKYRCGEPNRYGGGRLFEYKYMDMDQTIGSALKLAKKLL